VLQSELERKEVQL
jgi:growth arrest-specific protein 8